MARDYPRVAVFGLRDLICTCSAYMNGIPLYYDEGNLSIPGFEILGSEILRKVQFTASGIIASAFE